MCQGGRRKEPVGNINCSHIPIEVDDLQDFLVPVSKQQPLPYLFALCSSLQPCPKRLTPLRTRSRKRRLGYLPRSPATDTSSCSRCLILLSKRISPLVEGRKADRNLLHKLCDTRIQLRWRLRDDAVFDIRRLGAGPGLLHN